MMEIRHARRRVKDFELDALVPRELRHLSSMHWTPVDVAARAASLLCATDTTRVLDIGAGIGKLCTIGAMTGRGTWVGVEHQAPLVEAANELARMLGVADRARFVHADAFALDWAEFDALYLYNPFELALFGESGAQARRIERVEHRLAALPTGTRVVTLHGFGGAMPETFELRAHESGCDLALWVQG